MWSVISGQASSTRGEWVGDFIQVFFHLPSQTIFPLTRGVLQSRALSWRFPMSPEEAAKMGMADESRALSVLCLGSGCHAPAEAQEAVSGSWIVFTDWPYAFKEDLGGKSRTSVLDHRVWEWRAPVLVGWGWRCCVQFELTLTQPPCEIPDNWECLDLLFPWAVSSQKIFQGLSTS